MNKMTFEKLQYNELKEMVKSHCVSSLGKELLDKLQPSTNSKVVKNRLNETSEARKLLDAENHLPLKGISNINYLMEKLEKGMILGPSELVAISDFLRGCRVIKKFMLGKEFFAPVLHAYSYSMMEFQSIEEDINYSIRGNRVDSEASKELKRIRNQMAKTEEKIEERLNKFLKSNANKQYIQEFFISKKDDRFTIPIKASYKNQVEGTIIEASSKGSTVFIEPAAISKLNAELATLKAEESMEEYQILATLSGSILEQTSQININIELIAQYDMIFAKAKFSKTMDGIEPKLNNHGYIKLISCKHPLLTGNIVPLDFEIGKDYRSLIITGPNAGGKTVVLKTIGILTLAIMSGFHIAAAEGTELAVFNQIFVDIGDNQSIENSLSTFSSHMKNISEIMNASTNNTLLLFDEIGSGTEPNEGAALAIAILEEFYQMGCMTVATTHYGEIKRYSEMHSDFMNAAMQFNSEALEPMYKLLIGKSGDSNALWISKKMNLREKVLQKAQRYIENKTYDLERVRDNKIKKPVLVANQEEVTYEFEVGDRVKLTELEDYGIVYEKKDNHNNVSVFYKNEIVKVNIKRLQLEGKATDLYPEGYDLNSLFVSYAERKFQHDMERGSKKALKKVSKEIKKRLNE
ncbi:endonuclease MutS2 [Psychrobacillus lasiicapitis]|uniref:Endonuclease MutS2 n=1 Tax=Psychrobacillus lasiicapitis TaxID=1636719 RepID=A0A544T1V4_9BACI|nr:endonuclease MutS2 [Psychrobacillus lasiicapitis]TQR11436.1 endonuclease MutS2 [Psychrobacillus lasiicapitis]GGA40554.1 endonuclease MutS2 [Psychrobacillus lasiicapitis]